jgi:signal transduction histidine kinase
MDVYMLPWIELVENVPTPFWVIGPDADLWFGNRAWRSLTSAGAITLAERSTGWLQALHEDDRGSAVTAFRAATRFRQPVNIDLRLLSGGTYRVWSFVGTPYSAPTGEVEMFVGVAHDRTPAREAQKRLRELGARLVAAQESERARIARELHDDLAQRVALLTTKLGSAAQMRPFSATTARRTLDDVRTTLQDITNAIHLLSCELHPPKLTLLGLGPTLRAFCDEVATTSGITVQFTEGVDPVHVGQETSLCVFRVMQEAVQNAVKHSGAQRIEVRLRRLESQLTLWVADNGAGFVPSAPGHNGLGLMTMRERVELAGGRLRMISEPACGTVVEAIVPIQSPAPAQA